MHRDLVVKGRSLGGSSDLTLLAPIRQGFVDSLESVTHKTRIKRVLEVLHGARSLAHEHALGPLLSDSVERVGAIQSVRVAVLEPEDKVLLAVTFDGPWDAYIRVLWDKVGSLLDLIFFDTVDYVTAEDHAYDAWRDWGRRVQVETGFFYGPPESTARDALYWRRVEQMQARAPIASASAESDLMRASLPPAEVVVERFLSGQPFTAADEPGYKPVTPLRMVRERMRNGLRALAALYRLTDLYRPGTPDGEVLRRASLSLLREFVSAYDGGAGVGKNEFREARHGEQPDDVKRGRFVRQLDWLLPENEKLPRPAVPAPAPPSGARLDAELLKAIQGGIVRPYKDVTHGVALFLDFDGIEKARDFLAWACTQVASGEHEELVAGAPPVCNLVFTPAGLRAVGLQEDQLELFPEEFRMGMARRAGQLGDVRLNHPLRWRLPPVSGDGPGVDPERVHAVLFLRCKTDRGAQGDAAVALSDPHHPLASWVEGPNVPPGARIVATQAMKRLYADDADTDPSPRRTRIQEHFGYSDGNGQPDLERQTPPFTENLVHVGEVLVGQANASDPAYVGHPNPPAGVAERMGWLGNGSFLVVRKYRQFVGRLQEVVAKAAQTLPANAALPSSSNPEELVYAKLMGRWRDGTPVVVPRADDKPQPFNNFVYRNRDPGLCPLDAHIRLANPRMPHRPGVDGRARPPRLMRRSMSYGPRFSAQPSDDVDRGLIFMAFNASIAEQYEVVQRWLNGANASGVSSGRSCPFTGVPANGQAKSFRFEEGAKAYKVGVVPAPQLFEEPATLTRLDWGVYLFMPSLAVLERLRDTSARAVATLPRAAALPWRLSRGRELLAELNQVRLAQGDAAAVQAWKRAIEDPESIDRLDGAAVWAAIREDHGGLLRTPYGTLVAARELLCEVMRDKQQRYSVRGQMGRMDRSFGGVALGKDDFDGTDYWQDSDPVNSAIDELTTGGKQGVYDLAFTAAQDKIKKIVEEAQRQARKVGDTRFEVGLDARELLDEVLACLSDYWFGLQEAVVRGFLVRGSNDWAWQREDVSGGKPGDPPIYPGQFTALSRYMFQPHPGKVPVELGEAYGQALRKNMRAFVESVRAGGSAAVPLAPDGQPAPIAKAIFEHPAHGNDADFVARTMVGVLMGFTPTIIGAVLNVLREWFGGGQFNPLRAALSFRTDLASAHEVILAPMSAASRMRPMPQIAWRTVRKPHRLRTAGGHAVDLVDGDLIVLALVSGGQQSLADGGDPNDTARLMFGGVRTFDGQRDHPTHACPGFEAGMQAMLGTLSALLSWQGAADAPQVLRPGSSATAFVIEGRASAAEVQPAGPAPAAAAEAQRLSDATRDIAEGSAARKPAARSASKSSAILAAPTGRRGLVIGWGDSWLDDRLPWQDGGTSTGRDLRDSLAGFGYEVPADFCAWETWPTVQSLAAQTELFCDWLRSEVETRPDAPLKAVLLSGGGNDVAGPRLQLMLEPLPAPNGPFKTDEIDACMAELHEHYTAVVNAVVQRLDELEAVGSLPEGMPPILLHGYDYPFAAVNEENKGPPQWLQDPFKAAGYDVATASGFQAAGLATRELMQRFREELRKVADASNGRVIHVDLLGTIETCWPDQVRKKWDNDLHPKDEAYEQLAIRIDQAIP